LIGIKLKERRIPKEPDEIPHVEISPIDEELHIIGVLLDLPEGSATKFVSHRGYDKLLCEHVYFGFCQDCPQYRCRKRRI
jgi:hypothetical protein